MDLVDLVDHWRLPPEGRSRLRSLHCRPVSAAAAARSVGLHYTSTARILHALRCRSTLLSSCHTLLQG